MLISDWRQHFTKQRSDSTRTPVRRLTAAATAAGALALAPWLAPGIASAAPLPASNAVPAVPGTGQAVRILLPSNAGATSSGFLNGVSCYAAGSCVAGGGYADRWHRLQAMAVTQSGSRWARARELRMPSNANADPAALVNSVSCPRAGACVAVGYYSSGTRLQGFVASQTRSGWARAHRITLPANTAPRTFFQLDAVSCTGPGSCVVVGDYRDRWGHLVILAVTESGGRWHQARELRMPANAQADPEAAVLSVSCSRAGSCSAGGEYLNKANDFLPVAVTESGGRWHQGVAIKLPFGAAANPDAFLNSVTCTRPGSCVAVGGYDDTALNAYSFAVTQTAGVWSRAKKVATVPSDAAPHPRALLHSVTCTPSGGCAAVGNYLDTDGGTASYAALGRGARLIVARAIRLPSDAVTGGLMRTQLGSVSCTARGYCVAVGYYGAKSNRIEPMAASTPLH